MGVATACHMRWQGEENNTHSCVHDSFYFVLLLLRIESSARLVSFPSLSGTYTDKDE